MTPHTFAMVALRVVAVYVVAQILFQLTYMLTFSFGSDGRLDSLHLWLIYGSCVVFGLGLWWLAPSLASRAVRSAEAASGAGEPWSARDVQRVAISLMGIWFIVQALPSLVFQLLMYVRVSDEVEDASRLLEGLVPDGARLLLGLLLLLGASFWSELLARIQEFGLSHKTRA